MEQVWKCDFCTDTNKSPDAMRAHESECSFNPSVKACWTCRHQIMSGALISGLWNECAKGHDVCYVDEVGEEGSCKDWEQSKITNQ